MRCSRTSKSRPTTRCSCSSPNSARLPETIRSRCQPVPFQPPLAPGARGVRGRAASGPLARAARRGRSRGGRPARSRRPSARPGCGRAARGADRARALRRTGRSRSTPRDASRRSCVGSAARPVTRAARGDARGTSRELHASCEQRARRVARGAEREEIVEALDLLAGWYRDVAAVGARRNRAALNADRTADLEPTPGSSGPFGGAGGGGGRRDPAEFRAERHASLALEALFIRLRHGPRPDSSGRRPRCAGV